MKYKQTLKIMQITDKTLVGVDIAKKVHCKGHLTGEGLRLPKHSAC